MQPVKITVISENSSSSGTEKLEVVSFGRLTEKNGIWYARYAESETTGFAGTNTTLKWKEESLVLIRTGTLEHRQEFGLGQVYHSLYQTPYLTIPMVTATEALQIRKQGTGWVLDLVYDLFYAETEKNHIKMKIVIEEDKRVEYQGNLSAEH